jgi:PRD1 phage membrane DNA delivery
MSSGALLAGFTALITLAVIAVILSQNAQTASVLQALGNAVSTSIGAAVAPVTQTGNTGMTGG